MRRRNAIFLIFLILLYGCGNSAAEQRLPAEFGRRPGTRIRVGLVLSSFGLGDDSFNDMQYNGLIEAYRHFDIDISFGVSAGETVAAYKKVFDKLLRRDRCDIVLAFHGFMMSKTASVLAPEYPGVSFIVINYPHVQYSNVYVCSFATDEGSFLAGYLAASMSAKEKAAMIIGTDIPALEVFRRGFSAGVLYRNPGAPPLIRYCSRYPDFSGFTSPARGYRIARRLYRSGVRVIYSVAGATGNGIIQAARDSGRFVIGVDTDQDMMAPGFVLTSMMKRFDVVVYTMVSNYMKRKLGGRRRFVFNLRNGGISLSPMHFTKKKIPRRIREAIRRLQKMIVRGDLRIPK